MEPENSRGKVMRAAAGGGDFSILGTPARGEGVEP